MHKRQRGYPTKAKTKNNKCKYQNAYRKQAKLKRRKQ